MLLEGEKGYFEETNWSIFQDGLTKILELLRDSSDDKENQCQELVSLTLLVAGSDKGKPRSAGI